MAAPWLNHLAEPDVLPWKAHVAQEGKRNVIRAVLVAVGALLTIAGAVFALQGFGVLG